MDDRALLLARGWREVGPDGWVHPCGDPAVSMTRAAEVERGIMKTEVFEHGSVIYRPTAEQAQTSPLCRALGTMGATERDVIEHLFQAYGALERNMRTLRETQPPPAIAVDFPSLPLTKEELGLLLRVVRASPPFDGDGALLRKLRELEARAPK